MHLLPSPEEVAAQASIELLAMQLYHDERHQSHLQDIDDHPTWIELTIEDRNEYRLLATKLLQREYKQ